MKAKSSESVNDMISAGFSRRATFSETTDRCIGLLEFEFHVF
jgi:hypothetical protein